MIEECYCDASLSASSSSSSSSNTTTDSSTSSSSSRSSSSSSAPFSTSISGTKKYCNGFGHISSFITSATSSAEGSPLSQNHEKNVRFSSGRFLPDLAAAAAAR